MAVNELKRKGYEILERNYRLHRSEIDIIASKDGVIVFVEVKYRINNAKGEPYEAVDYYKQKAISRVAEHYLAVKVHSIEVPCRFDVISILDDRLEHIENAFDHIR
ncbi:MAG: YraN family protein [Lachnospiraceae bacterium]|nr:YraN family protein [Lachnospiraceae bacterium]